METLISIGLPVKNGFLNTSGKSLNISSALNALINQSYKNIEIIISNNCSTDETTSYLNKIKNTDNRIKLYNQKEEISWAENFNFVLNKSKGKYFKWNAADDMISTDFIEKNFEFLEKNTDYVASSCKFYYEENPNEENSFCLDGNLYSRLKKFFKYRHNAHNILFSLIRKESLYKTIDISKDYWAVDWMLDLDLLIQGKFNTINQGNVIYGTNGMSRQKNFIKRKIYQSKKIYILLPFYELMKNLFFKTIFSKEISFIEKLSIYYSSIKINFYFFKKSFFDKN